MSQFTRRDLFRTATAILPAFWLVRAARAQGALKLEPLTANLSVLSGAGGNIAVLRGKEGVLLVDTGIANVADAIVKEVPGKISTVIITHYHYDHVGANERFIAAGAQLIAHENCAKRIEKGRPQNTYSKEGSLAFAGEKVVYRHMPPAHTDGDTTVLFTKANVFHTGDLFFQGMYPYIDYAASGSIEGMIAAQGRIIDSVDAKMKIIPGHGPVTDREGLRECRAMLEGINQNVSKLVKEGKTLAETQAAKPTQAFDAKWGNGFLKPDAFVELLWKGKTGK